jgi:hypothetical protein
MSKSFFFPSNKHSFEYYVNTFSFLCGSKGKCLVFSWFYHTTISFVIGSLSYNIMYLSWLATSYNCPSFTMLVWSYHWQFKYPFASVPQWEWTYNSSQHTLEYCCSYCFGKRNTCLDRGLPPFPSTHLMMNGYSYYQKQLSYFDRHCHCWPDSHRYGTTKLTIITHATSMAV